MNNLKTVTKDFTVAKNGEAFISQPRLASLINVAEGTITSYISRSSEIINTINGLDSNSLEVAVAYFAMESRVATQEAKDLYRLLAKAGAKAYIYDQAGFKLSATPKPMTKRELAKHNYELIMIAEDAIDAKIEMEKQCLLKLAKIGNHLAGSTISEIGDNVTFNTAAKLVSTNLGIDLGHNSLMKLCRNNGWLMTGKRSPSEKNMPPQCKIQYFKIKLFFNENTGKYSITPVITPLGLIKMVKLIPNWYVQTGKLIQF